MTVGVSRTGSIIVYGFLADSFGQLDYTTIDYGPSYGVEWITANETGGNDYVAVSLSARVPLGSVFNLGGREFTADADSEQRTLGLYNWNLPTDFGWIDGQKVTVSANLSPAPESATVDGTTLVLTHAEDLDTGSSPAAGSYTVKLGGSAGPTVSSVAVDARTVTLTLATTADTDVTVDYDAPVSSPLQDVSGLDAPDSEDFPVTNNTGATNTIPVVDNPIPDQAATVGMAFSYEFPAETFNDDDGDTLTYMATKDDDNALPSWLTFDDTTRTFSGTPQGGDVGTVTVKVTASDGEGATVSDEFDIVVSAANSAPTSADNTVTTDEDTAYTFAAADFNFDDTDSGDALASVTLVTLPAAGALELDGAAVSVDQVVAEVDIVKLTFTPALNANGLGYASFTFKVNDGTADSVDAYTMTVNVTPVNDAATGAPEITGTPQVGQALTAGMDTIADAEDLPTTTFPLGYSFQWVRVAGSTETDLTGETNITYSPASADEGNTIKVKVSFTDGAGNSETVPSDAVGPVVPAAGACITGHDWCATMTVEVETDEQGDITFVGFSHTGLGTLNPNTISYGSKHYETLSVRWTPDSPIADLEIIFEVTAQNAGDLPSGSVFGFDEIERTEEAGKSVYNNPGEYAWDDLPTDFGWIDGQKVTVSANLSPAPESATVDGTTLVLTHAEDLDTGSTPAAGSYTVKLGGSAGPTVSSVAVDARTVTLTLATAITAADTDVTVDYDAPVSSPLQDVSGLDAPDFEDFEVTNNTATSNDATLSALTVNDGTTDHTIDLTAMPYTLNVGNAVTTVTLTATPAHTGASVSAVTLGGSAIADTVFTDGITVPSLVEGGANVIVVTVTAEDGTTMQTYTVTITDDDESSFTVIAAPTSIAEDGGATTVTVSTGGVTFADDRQIALTLTGTATKGTDYTVDSETLTLTAGETSVATMVTAVQDAVDEEDETIDITAEGAQTRVTITDDDESMFTVIAAPTSIAEDGGATTVTVSTGGVTFADDRQIALTLTGTATKGTDYTVDSETLTLTAGETSVATMVTAVQDAVDEGDETIDITAEGAQTRVTITDDDESMFTVIAAPTSIAEDGGATTVTVSTGGVTFADDRQIALTLTGTATKGTDYTVDSETLTLTAGETSVATMVTAVDDAVDEEDETIDITAEGAQTRVTITDDDESMFTVIAAPTSIAEDGGATTVTVSTGGVTFADDRQIALTLTGTATKGTDYTVDSETLTLTAGETSVATMVTAVQDAVDEEDETIDITAEGAQTRVTITDDDESMFTVIAAPTSIAEDGGATTVTVSTGGVTFADDRQIALTLTGTATKGTDYTVDSETLTLTAGETSVATMVTAVQDAVDEEDETIDITAEGAQTRVTITDDDESMFTVIAAPTSIAEDGGATTVTVSTGGVTFADDRQIALTLTGTATKGTDYTVDSETLTLTAGETSVATMVTAVQDAVDEEDETIDITAEGAQTRVTITDDDESMFTVIAAPTSIAEDGGATTVTVSTGGVTFADDRQIALTLTGTATKGTDYTVDSETLTLTAGETSVATMVTAVDDAVDEEDETIDITAEGAQTRVTITDDDEPGLDLSKTSLGPEEGGRESYTVALETQPTAQVTVKITGYAGTDLTLNKTDLTFTTTNWASAQTVRVTADMDDDAEDEEEMLTHTASGGGYGSVTKDLPVTVKDTNESGLELACDMSMETVTVHEGETARFTIVIDPPLPRDDILLWSVLDHGDATTPEDGLAHLKAGATRVYGAVETYTDDETEPTEGFQISMDWDSWLKRPDWRSAPSCTGRIYIRDGESNGAPVFDDGERTKRKVAENTASGKPVGKPVTAEDPNDDTVTYALEGQDAALFSIDAGTGQLRTAAALDYESKAAYEVTVRANDDWDDDPRTATIVVTVNVDDEREPPATPDALTVVGSGRSLLVSWSAPENTGPPMKYDLQYRETGRGLRTDAPRNLTGRSATLDGLDPNTEYQVKVLAHSDEGTSGWSAPGYGCTGPNASCAGPDPAQVAPLTASFEGLPDAHDGATEFTFELRFSESFPISYLTVRDDAFTVTNGRVTRARRLDNPHHEQAGMQPNREWEITVAPDTGAGDVTVTLPATTDCAATGAVCTGAGTMLSGAVSVTVPHTYVDPNAAREQPGTSAAPGSARGGASEPVVTAARIASGAGGAWSEGDAVEAVVRFSEAVTVDTTGGTPSLAIVLGDAGRAAVYAGGTGTTELVFRHEVGAADDGARGARVVAGGLALNGATIRNAAGVDAELGFALAPVVTSVAVEPDPDGDGVWSAGEAVTVTFGFSDAVTVRTEDGTPSVSLHAGGAREAAYAGGSGTAALRFAYTVTAADGPVASVLVADNGLELNGGTIVGPTGLAAALAHAGVGRSGTPAPTPRGTPALSVADASAPEGGTLAFAVTLDPAAPGAVSVDWATSDGTAKAGLDYTAASGTLVFASGETSKTVRVAVLADEEAEGAETMGLTLSNASGAGLADAAATGTVSDPAQVAPAGPPPAVSIADATVEEGPGAVLAFAVTLDRASQARATVDWETRDGNARAGDDYVAASGTLSFEPGETAKTIPVTVLDDSHDEGREVMLVVLSNPVGATIAKAAAGGTIENTDHMPQAWLGRFGRTVAEQVLDAVEERIRAAPQAGVQVTVAGQRIGAAQAPDADALEEAEAQARLEEFSTWLRGEACRDDPGAGGDCPARTGSRAVTARDLLTGSSFALTTGADGIGGGLVSLWGRGALTRFDGREDELSLSGEVTGALLGADWTRAQSTLGLMVSYARGEGSYRGADSGEVASTVSGFYPYGRYALSDRVTVWGAAGYGAGTLTLTPADGEPLETDMNLAMAAAGLRGTVVEAPADGGPELAVKADALAVWMSSAATRGGAGGNLAAAAADVMRLRLGLEGTWRGLVIGTGTLVPRLELGVRQDGGDAETGFGLDLGGGLAWADPGTGIRAEVSGRGLLTYESAGFRERGIAVSFGWDPTPGSDRGPSLTLSQTMGVSAQGGADALLGRTTLAGLAANDDGDELERRRMEVKLGYGFGAFGNRFTSTPEAGFGMSEGHRDYSLAWRFVRDRRRGDIGSLEFSLEARRRESANDPGSGAGAEPEHSVGFRMTARF